MFRVKKSDGWNRYRVQKRFLFIFWLNVKGADFYSKDAAIARCARLIMDG